MTPLKYFAADVDGVLCVACEVPDYSEPKIVTNFWPTKTTTKFILDLFDGLTLAELTVTRSTPGEYFIGERYADSPVWRFGRHVELLDMAYTQPVKTTSRPAAPPKTRCRHYWSSGGWTVHRGRKVERLSPL